MKTTLNNLKALTVLAIILFVNSSYAAVKPKIDSLVCLKLNGLILKAPHQAERGSYKVELLSENVVIDSSNVPVNKEFEFTLSKNTWYTVRITKEGRVPLLISVDTKIDPQNALIYKFEFETELLDAKNVNTNNKSIIDFPIGVVKFDKENNRFYPIEDYTADIKQKIFDPSKANYFNSDAQDNNKSMMANQNDDDMIVK